MDNIGGGDGPMPHIVAGGPLWMNDSSAPSSYYPQSQLDIAFTQMSSPYDQNQSASQPIQPYYPHDPAVYAVAGNSNSQALGFYDTSQATTSFAVGDGGSGSELFPREPAVMPLPIRAGTKCCSVCQATETPTWRRHMLTNKCVCNACGLYFKLHKRNRQFTHNARGQYVVKRQPRSTNKRPKNTRIYATQLNLIPSSAPDMPPAQRGDELTNVATDTTAAAVAAPPPDMEYMSTQGYNTAGGFRHYNV
ncbi:hypothetical protein GGI00_001701 [Coemansia sp. RSA 2681]|nr:hypothetical protein GGI00_001701 [Coemansia sp. RSA 2681]